MDNGTRQYVSNIDTWSEGDIVEEKIKKYLCQLNYTALNEFSQLHNPCSHVCQTYDFLLCLRYFLGIYRAVCVFTSVILGILTDPVTSIQDTHCPRLNWKPNVTFTALESRMSAVPVCCFREYSQQRTASAWKCKWIYSSPTPWHSYPFVA